MHYFFISFLCLLLTGLCQSGHCDVQIENITIAILAKDKAHTLPYYLACIEAQTWPKKKTNLYIRTNNNNDNTTEVLKDWVEKEGGKYLKVYFDDSDVEIPIQKYKQHEWNIERFRVLAKIRQDSLNWAKKENSHYFVADCDNFIIPRTIEELVNVHLPIIAPLLRTKSEGSGYKNYSNYHFAIDSNGYMVESPYYHKILAQEIRGLIEMPVVHCTYLVRWDFLNQLSYNDNSDRYEYVMFSDSARKQNIQQYLDNRKIYGWLSFAETPEQFLVDYHLNVEPKENSIIQKEQSLKEQPADD